MWPMLGIQDLMQAHYENILRNVNILVCSPLLSVNFWLLTLIQSVDMDIRQKENGSKRSFLPEIGAQTFYTPLFAVTTACCVP